MMAQDDQLAVKPNTDVVPAAKSAPNRYVILDTNIFSYFLSNENIGGQILKILVDDVAASGYGIAISDFILFELINEVSMEKEKLIAKMLENMTSFPVTKEVCVAAAHLASFYKADGIPMSSIAVGDRFVAATAVMKNALIFTANARDFPPPCFREILRRELWHQKKATPVCTVTYFMEPQLEFIAKRHNARLIEDVTT